MLQLSSAHHSHAAVRNATQSSTAVLGGIGTGHVTTLAALFTFALPAMLTLAVLVTLVTLGIMVLSARRL